MASLEEVRDALRRVLDKIDQSIAAYHHAAGFAEQARDLLALAGSGSNQADVEQACAQFTRVIEGITEPEGQVSGLATAAGLTGPTCAAAKSITKPGVPRRSRQRRPRGRFHGLRNT